jgi:hypothetical protein
MGHCKAFVAQLKEGLCKENPKRLIERELFVCPALTFKESEDLQSKVKNNPPINEPFG